MTATIKLELSDELIEALRATGEIKINITGGTSGQGGGGGADEPRAGSWPAKILAWAEKRKRPFGAPEVTKRFKLSRAHASMVLSKLAGGGYPIRRVSRGVYEYRA
jgi:hypothetical protein